VGAAFFEFTWGQISNELHTSIVQVDPKFGFQVGHDRLNGRAPFLDYNNAPKEGFVALRGVQGTISCHKRGFAAPRGVLGQEQGGATPATKSSTVSEKKRFFPLTVLVWVAGVVPPSSWPETPRGAATRDRRQETHPRMPHRATK